DGELGIPFQVTDVAVHAGHHVIERQHLPAFGKEPVAQMRPQKTRTTRDHRTHSSSMKIGQTSLTEAPAIDHGANRALPCARSFITSADRRPSSTDDGNS